MVNDAHRIIKAAEKEIEGVRYGEKPRPVFDLGPKWVGHLAVVDITIDLYDASAILPHELRSGYDHNLDSDIKRHHRPLFASADHEHLTERLEQWWHLLNRILADKVVYRYDSTTWPPPILAHIWTSKRILNGRK